MNISEKVYNYPTKYKEGFVKSEIEILLKEFADVDMDKFNSVLNGITCIRKNKETVIYHCDIHQALIYGIEKRNIKQSDFD